MRRLGVGLNLSFDLTVDGDTDPELWRRRYNGFW